MSAFGVKRISRIEGVRFAFDPKRIRRTSATAAWSSNQCLMNGYLNAVFPLRNRRPHRRHLFVLRLRPRRVARLCREKNSTHSPDFVDCFNPWSNIVAHRDAAPIRYWTIMGVYIT